MTDEINEAWVIAPKDGIAQLNLFYAALWPMMKAARDYYYDPDAERHGAAHHDVFALVEQNGGDLDRAFTMRIVPREGGRAPLVEISQPQMDADPKILCTVDGIDLIGGKPPE
jgi:hypothetical protein